jgi:phosphoribosylformimino-5-aminoimidazole carboxamide ribotide isomerase
MSPTRGAASDGPQGSEKGVPHQGARGDQPFRAIPAVDLKGGRCVQLVGGRPEEERVSLPDPVSVARRWRASGFATLHVVDLDAALGTGDNLSVIRRIAEEAPGDLQVGGGIRDTNRADSLLADGCERIIVGTRAVDDPEWREALSRRHPGRIVVAVDIRDGVVLRKGWTEASGIRALDLLAELDSLPLAGILCTDVGREGRVEGIDRDEVARILEGSRHPIWISGGVTTLEELRFLEAQGARGAVLGMALYQGALNANQTAEEFGR